MTLQPNKILGSCLEDCVHVAGILNFFQIAQDFGFQTEFLGPAQGISRIISSIQQSDAQIIAISYRLTPSNGFQHIQSFIQEVKTHQLTDRIYLFGGLPELVNLVDPLSFFAGTFIGGESVQEILPILQHVSTSDNEQPLSYPDTLLERIKWKKPYPILRAHFGLPDFEITRAGILTLANAKVLDVISIAPDQAAQEWLQHPEILSSLPRGAGGVPIRSREDLIQLYQASRLGNFPLVRIYSGTQDLEANGQLFHDTLHNAWAAIPIFWYSKLDGRGPKPLNEAIQEHFTAIKWHAQHQIPVEINDPHQWGLRMAPDHLVVADAFLSAYVAKAFGVRTFVQQLMFNTPMGNSWTMDLARVLAMMDIVQPLKSHDFHIITESRAGLGYFSPILPIAKGQLSASTLIQMSVHPDIMHIVSYCEGDHAAQPEDIIESTQLVKKIIQDAVQGLPNFTIDPVIQQQKDNLIREATLFLHTIYKNGLNLGIKHPFLNAEYLASLVKQGIFDAPQLRGNPSAAGSMKTRLIHGRCVVMEGDSVIFEIDRLKQFGLSLSTDPSLPIFFAEKIFLDITP